jgi:hypothetical protein
MIQKVAQMTHIVVELYERVTWMPVPVLAIFIHDRLDNLLTQ